LPLHIRIGSVLAALALICHSDPARADDSTDVQAIVNAVIARTQTVRSYTADLSLHVRMHSFPFIGMTFSGVTAYERPGKFAVTLHTLPAIARAFAKMSGDVGDHATWVQRYDISLATGSQAPAGQIVLRLTPRQPCQVAFAQAYVDRSNKTIQRIEWHYVNGGHIDVDEHYAIQNGILLTAGQSAEIAMPGIHASASSNLSNIVVQTDVAALIQSNKP
jgi:hypothetical protein